VSGVSRIQSALHRAEGAISFATARVGMRGVTSIGARARTCGLPYVKNRGCIDIGDDFFLSSEPTVSHIVVSRGGRIAIGNGVTIESGAAIACELGVHIGDGVHIGRNVMILDTDFHDATSMDSPSTPSPIVIEDGVCLEEGVVVLKGARIGKGATIGSASVVSGVIAMGVFASGVPARVRGPKRAAEATGDLTERVRTVIGKTFGASHTIEGGWDSLGTLRLLLALEDEFKVHLAEGALFNIKSVGAIASVIENAGSR
jgi:acetyltransferase-like isoleucine patch superfamily enzyme/acyl carrier protein